MTLASGDEPLVIRLKNIHLNYIFIELEFIMEKFEINEGKIHEVIMRVLGNLIKPIDEDERTLDFDTDGMTYEEMVREVIRRSRRDLPRDVLSEGLITSYDAETVARKVNSRFDLSVFLDDVGDDNVGVVNVIGVLVPKKMGKYEIGELMHFMSSCGYFKNQKQAVTKDGNFYIYVFEPTFSKDITQLVKNRCRFLYHMTPKIYLNKILRNGIVPKGSNEGGSGRFFYPDRTFLMMGDVPPTKRNTALYSVQKLKKVRLNGMDNENVPSDHVMLKIDTALLSDDMKFYADPLTNNSIFTYDTISPNAIVDIEDFDI